MIRLLLWSSLFFTFVFLEACNENRSYQLKWDFSKPKDLVYSYKETIFADIAGHPNNSYTGKSKMIIEGKLVVSIQEGKSAEIYMKDLLMWKYFLDENENITDTLSDYIQERLLSKINEFSEIDSSKAKNPLFGYIFLLPNKPVMKGQTEKILVGNLNPSEYTYTKGGVEFILKEIKSIKNYEVAVLENIIDVSQVQMPGADFGNYNTPTRGNSFYEFDLTNNYFISGEIYYGINWSVDTVKTISSHEVNFDLIEIQTEEETIFIDEENTI